MTSHTVPDPPLTPWMLEARRVAAHYLDPAETPVGVLEVRSIAVSAWYVECRRLGIDLPEIPDLFDRRRGGRVEGWQDSARRMAEAIVEATS